MRTPFRTGLFLVLSCLLILAQPSQDARAKGPKGGGGRGAAKSHASSGSGHYGGGYSGRSSKGAPSHTRSATHNGYSGGNKGKVSHQTMSRKGFPSAESDGEGTHPWSMQRANEQRKLDHRMDVADRLDKIADQNGNSNLHETAERKREKAKQLYEKRMAKIDEKDPLEEEGDALQDPQDPSAGPADGESEVDSTDAPETNTDPTETIQKLTGRENALYRQLQNEQRKLARQMDTAERLWDAYEQTGDEQLADLAQGFEERALDQYEKRMEAIRSFQDRHGLPDMIGDGLPPGDSLRGERPGTLAETLGPLLNLLP